MTPFLFLFLLARSRLVEAYIGWGVSGSWFKKNMGLSLA